jgi:hypothetical protein
MELIYVRAKFLHHCLTQVQYNGIVIILIRDS